MSTDTETSTSSASSTDHKKRKSHKTHKRKSDKKHKKEKKQNRHKQKKRARHDSVKDETPAHTKPAVIAVATPTEANAFGPALPPHLIKDRPVVVGPVLPANFQHQLEAPAAKSGSEPEAESDGDAGIYGPVPLCNGESATVAMSSAQLELEQRALELKIAGIGGGAGNAAEQQEREEWMLELPQVGLKSGLAAIANMKRTFHQGKERPDFSDRSAWTKTPQDAVKPTQPTTSKSAAESLKRQAEATYERQRDEEQERIAKKHKKKHKRDESLLEIHQKKLRKEQKRKEKELAASGAKPERRPFSRDVDLKLNKIDSNQTKQIVDKAKILNTKFASGHAKYL